MRSDDAIGRIKRVMNKHNLIQLGALAQKVFGMRDGFRITEIPSDAPSRYLVAIPCPAEWNISHALMDYDEVILTKFGSRDNFERIWCGYSARANVLVIRESVE